MTINIAVLTSEALVLGCDSIASTTRHLLDPFALEVEKGSAGKNTIEFDYGDLMPHVSGAWGNVTKMFPLQTKGACVAAVTCGAAMLNNRTMRSLAAEFMEKQDSRATPRVNVEAVADDFMEFVSREFQRHYGSSAIPSQFWEGPEFLIGGYGNDDQLPSLCRANIKNRTVIRETNPGEFGLAWAGQSDAVERLLYGHDYYLQNKINKQVNQAIDEIYESTSDAAAKILQEVLDNLGKKMPDGVNTKLPLKENIKLIWDDTILEFEYHTWPIQNAIDFAAFLVNIQSAKSKFVPGVATVGGRTHIGVLTKGGGFQMLNEPELLHKNTGFSDDT